MKSILEVLVRRDNMSEEDAMELINEAKDELEMRLSGESNENAYEICMDYFGLEPDYIMELL